MKKTKGFLRFTGLLLLCLAACKKPYTCSCTNTCAGDTVQVIYDFKAKSKDADEVCKAYATTSGGCVSNCVLR